MSVKRNKPIRRIHFNALVAEKITWDVECIFLTKMLKCCKRVVGKDHRWIYIQSRLSNRKHLLEKRLRRRYYLIYNCEDVLRLHKEMTEGSAYTYHGVTRDMVSNAMSLEQVAESCKVPYVEVLEHLNYNKR